MKKLILSLIATAGLMTLSYGQYVDQSLIFSQQNFGSTARSKAMGNAFGAVGGDFSSLSINPAGIGIYLRSETSGTLNVLGMNSMETTYRGQITDERQNNFNFRNFGHVLAVPVKGGGSGLVSFNFGIGFNKLNNFNQSISIGKNNSPYSRTDAFATNTNGKSSTLLLDENNPYANGMPWESKLAWETYLMNVKNPDNDGMGNTYESILLVDELVNQNMTINREGFVKEYVASLGANFNHQVYLGATVGMQDIYYNESKSYSEDGEFGRFDYYNTARTRGFGINLKFGVIYRPIPSMRVGLAIHTPTFFELKETYSSTMTSNLQDVSAAADGTHSAETPLGDYQYKLDTPTRIIGSLAWQFEKKGMISIDYERVDYSKMKYRNGRDGYNFSLENTDIRTIYNSVGNLRIGGEIKPTDALSLRVGYELFGNPYKSAIPDVNNPTILINQANKDFSYHTINAGVGYRINNLSFDVSYSMGNRTEFNYMDNIDSEVVKFQNKNNEVVFTLGIKL